MSGVVFRERKGRKDVTLNVTSLVDVLFLMLLFFMLTSTFKRAGELELNLPASTTSGQPPAAPGNPPVQLVLTEQGTLLLNGDLTSFDRLQAALNALHQADPAGRVMIEAETGVEHGQVVQLLDAVRTAGFKGVGIGTRMAPPPMTGEPK